MFFRCNLAAYVIQMNMLYIMKIRNKSIVLKSKIGNIFLEIKKYSMPKFERSYWEQKFSLKTNVTHTFS